MPEDPRDILLWCEFIASKQGIYREAMRRIVSYFITDLEVNSAESSRDEKDKFKDFLDDTIDYKSVLNYVATDYSVYGNSFTSLVVPFRRYLSCPAVLHRVAAQESL